MTYTEEQKRIIESTGNIIINAVAGSGKTTTLIEYAHTRPAKSRILYLAFNNSVQKEAARKFKSKNIDNVDVFTAHALAKKYVFAKNKFNIKAESYKTFEIAELLDLAPDPKNHTDLILAKHILRFAAFYCNSDVDSPTELNYLDTLADPQAIHFVSNYLELIEEKTVFFLKEMNQKKIDITHDFYLKKFQLSSPQLPYDYILFDEGQDASKAMLHVFLKQEAHKVIVGDTHQQIYGWRFAINSLQQVDFQNYPLSQSFRFDDQIAFLANNILDWKKKHFKQETITIKGYPVKKEFNSAATIARSNVALLDAAIKYIQQNPFSSIYFEGNISSYTYAEETGTSIYDVLNLMNGKHDLIKDKLVRKMANLEELIQYVEKTEDSSVGIVIEIVTKYGDLLPDLIKKLKQKHVLDDLRHEASMIFSTVHRCKGMEYDSVFLCDDFITQESLYEALKEEEITEKRKLQLAEEVNILYVACTRTKSKLHLPTNINPFDTIQWEFPGDKMDKTELLTKLKSINTIEDLKILTNQLGLNDNKPTNHGKKWDAEEISLLKRLHKEKKNLEEIALQLKRSTIAIEMKINSMGLSPEE
jgi:superfamily I DNA/RNA helicase